MSTEDEPGSEDVYTFGTSPDAARRLDALAALYAPRTADLLRRWATPSQTEAEGAWDVDVLDHAVDLGCGPGHTTRLVHEVTGARRTTGVERSPDFLALARSRPLDGVGYVEADVAVAPLPVDPADLVHVRFLLTHLADPQHALVVWAAALRPGGRLVVHEVAALDSDDPTLHRYYALVALLQEHHGQALDIGARTASLARAAGLDVVHEDVVAWWPDAARMAALHVANLRTWRHDPFIAGTVDPAELDALDADLVGIASGRPSAPVEQSMAEVVVRR